MTRARRNEKVGDHEHLALTISASSRRYTQPLRFPITHQTLGMKSLLAGRCFVVVVVVVVRMVGINPTQILLLFQSGEDRKSIKVIAQLAGN